jgi:5-methylcytosine-specific restriction endonuclease McrBC regulatory subunit McrC
MFEGIAISRDIFEGEATEPGVAFYFVSYILISAMMLLNVVVAVLLEEFQNHVRRGKEKQQHETEQAAEKIKSKGCTHFHESSKY